MSEEVQNESHSDPNKRKNRKRPKNFFKNAKMYAKKGQFGRGTKMSEELYQYFLGILDAMKAGVEDEDQRQSLVSNVLERTKGEELNIIGNQLGCRVVELLLPYSSPEDLERYFQVLYPELRRLCSDNFTSHVVETLLRVASERATDSLQNGETNDDSDNEAPKKKLKLESKQSKYSEEHVKNCYDFAIKICKYALNNLEDFVWDSYANHILRSAIKCLSGITLLPNEKPKVNMFVIEKSDKPLPPSPFMKKMVYRNVPDEYKELVTEFGKRLSVWPQFKDLPFQNITSGLLQVLLYAVKNVDKNLTRDLLKQLLNESFAPDDWVSTGSDDKKEEKIDLEEENTELKEESVVKSSTLPPVFESEPAVRLLEAALLVAKKKMYTQMYAKCFINRMGQLACLPMLNFTVQRLFDNCQIKEELEPMFDELSNKLGDLLACGNTGVLVSIAKACLRVKARQAQFLTSLESALKCTAENQKYFPVLCLRLLPADRVDLSKLDKEYFINVHGSVILQSILDFQRPAKAVNGLLELTSEQLVVIFSDAKGSHVADAFCKGQFVGVKARDKMIWKLKLEPMFDELSNKLGDLLACGNTGVLVSIAKACLRVKARQAQFLTSLESALKCTAENQKYFPVLCLRLLPADRVDLSKLDKEYFINVHGSVILQSILDFQRPAKAVNGLLELSSEQLVVIFSDAKGSHVADAFCKGQFVGVKARDKMIWKLKGFYQTLALSQHGSRAVERIFEAASLEQKIKIMTEMADKSNLLNSTKFGRVVASKLDVATFKTAQKQWEQKFKGK